MLAVYLETKDSNTVPMDLTPQAFYSIFSTTQILLF